MQSCINSFHRRLPSDKLYKFCLPYITQRRVVEFLYIGGYPAELQKFCLAQVAQYRVVDFFLFEARGVAGGGGGRGCPDPHFFKPGGRPPHFLRCNLLFFLCAKLYQHQANSRRDRGKFVAEGRLGQGYFSHFQPDADQIATIDAHTLSSCPLEFLVFPRQACL